MLRQIFRKIAAHRLWWVCILVACSLFFGAVGVASQKQPPEPKEESQQTAAPFCRLAEVTAGSAEDFSYYERNQTGLLTPYQNHGAGSGKMAEVIVPYAECSSSDAEDNRSDPRCSPLVRGTVDRVLKTEWFGDTPVCFLASGVKVEEKYLKITEQAYRMPENTLSVDACEENDGGLLLTLKTDWAVPVQLVTAPQTYVVGFQERPYNVESCTAEYLDIRFFDTTAFYGAPNVLPSDMVRDWEWIAGDDYGTLRLYLQKEGQYFGCCYALDDSGNFTFFIRRHIAADPAPVVMLDAGHGGSDPGALYADGTKESDLTLTIAQKTAELLNAQGVNVLLTREGDTDLSIEQRLAAARQYKPSLFVSIHCDSAESASLYGTHTFYYKNFSQPLAQGIQQEMAAVFGDLHPDGASSAARGDLGIKYYPFAVTRLEECPSVLVECGYLSNDVDGAFLASSAGQQKIAAAIAAGILAQLQMNVG